MRVSRRVASMRIAAGLVWLIVGCDFQPSSPQRLSRTGNSELDEALVQGVSSAMDASGKFVTNSLDPSAGAQLSESQATALAEVFGRHYAPHAKSALESERRGPIAFANLRPCGRVHYAASPYRQKKKLSIERRNSISPRWLVTLCSGPEPQLSIAIAAFATELGLKGDTILFPPQFGNEIFPRAIPATWESGLSILPESAAVLAYRVTGRRVVQTPRLLIPDPAWIPQAAQWVIDLENAPDDKTGRIERVFVGLRLDGLPARGASTVLVQVPDASRILDPHQKRLTAELLEQVEVEAGFPSTWRTAFKAAR